MNVDFEDSLDLLKLEGGFQGVQKLQPQNRLSEVFPDGLEDKHLHIAVENPITGAFELVLYSDQR
jgi:hypothetical protein